MTTKELNELKDKAYQNAKAHGFHDEGYSDEHYLMLTIVKLSNAVEAYSENKRADIKSYNEFATYWKDRDLAFQKYIKDSLEDKFADVIIQWLDVAGVEKFTFKDEYPKNKHDDYSIKKLLDKFGLPTVIFFIIQQLIYDSCGTKGITIVQPMIYTIDCVSFYLGADLWYFVKEKMKFNEGREKLHGKIY